MGCCCEKHSPCSFLLFLATCPCSFLYGSFDTGPALSKPVNGETGDTIRKGSKQLKSYFPPSTSYHDLSLLPSRQQNNSTTLILLQMQHGFFVSFGEQERQHKTKFTLLYFFFLNNTIIWEKSSRLQYHKILATPDIIFIYHNLECITLSHWFSNILRQC